MSQYIFTYLLFGVICFVSSLLVSYFNDCFWAILSLLLSCLYFVLDMLFFMKCEFIIHERLFYLRFSLDYYCHKYLFYSLSSHLLSIFSFRLGLKVFDGHWSSNLLSLLFTHIILIFCIESTIITLWSRPIFTIDCHSYMNDMNL